MAAINSIIFDMTNNMNITKDIQQAILQGQKNNIKIRLYFENEPFNYAWDVNNVFTRPDGSKSNNIPAVAKDGYFELTLRSWMTDIHGELKIATRIFISGEEYMAFDSVTLLVQESEMPSGDTITDTQYDAILGAVASKATQVEMDNTTGRVTDLEAEKVDRAGDTMSGDLDLDGNKLKNAKIDDGVADDDPVNKGQLDKKVDKVSGKGLSTNDYTNTDKQSVEKIPTIEQDILDLESDKVDKVSGMGLSSNDFTTTDKNKLSGIQAGAQVNAVTTVAGRTGAVVLAKADVGLGSVDNVQQIPLSQKGVVNGVAELDNNGKVPSAQLPSYVDDVLEYVNLSSFPETGEAGKIYIAQDTNKTYRWSGSAYIEISASLALGETSSTAYRGDRGKTAYDHTSLTNNPHSVTKTQVGLSNVDNTSDLDKPISTAQQTALDNKVDKNNPITAETKTKITYDSKGLVTSGADLTETDIPPLPASKITQDATHRFVTDAEKNYWDGKQDELITMLQAELNTGTATTGRTISAKVLRDTFYTQDQIDLMIGDIETALDAILGV